MTTYEIIKNTKPRKVKVGDLIVGYGTVTEIDTRYNRSNPMFTTDAGYKGDLVFGEDFDVPVVSRQFWIRSGPEQRHGDELEPPKDERAPFLVDTGPTVTAAFITPECRENRTPGGAWEEAVERLRVHYDDILHGWEGQPEQPTLNLVLTMKRPASAASRNMGADPEAER